MQAAQQRIFASFRLDLANEQLWSGKTQFPLRRKTFEVLRCLVDRPGELVTKAELLDAVWADIAVSDSMPSICVAELRKVLGDDARQPSIIETVHKRGYRFIAPVTQVTAVSPAHRPQAPALPPLVGREAEISELRRHLDQLRHGVGGFVLIGGVAGIGKTRLATELGVEAAQVGVFTLVGNCYDRGDPVPFVPFVEILETALESASRREAFREMLGADAAEISRLLPQLRRLFPDISAPMELAPSQSQRMLFNAVGGLLTRMAAATPLFLLLEDLHWADQGTLSLLDHLARTVQKIPVLIVGTHRYGKPYAPTLEELTRLRLAAQVSLHRFPQQAVAAMLSSLGGREASPALVNLLHKTADGNPFWIGELFRHLAERGELGEFDHTIRDELTPELRDLPHSLRPIIGRRLGRVSDATRDVLAAAAVIGRSFSFAMLEAATRTVPDLLRDHVEEAERAGLLTSTLEYPDTRFNFKHELIRQGVMSELSAIRRQQFHRQIADAIEQLYPDTLEDWTDDLAHHLWEAGAGAEAKRTLKWLKAAARRATAQGAYEAAIHYLRRGLEALKRLAHGPERSRQELKLHLNMAGPLSASKGLSVSEVETACTRARELCQSLGDIPELFAVLGGLSSIYFNRDDFIIARDLAEQMMRLAKKSQSSRELMWAHYALGTAQLNSGDFALARDSLERVVELYDRGRRYGYVQDPGATGMSFLAHALHFLGYSDQALKTFDKGLALAQELSHPYTLAAVLGHGGIIRCERGEFGAGEDLLAQMIAIAQQHGFSGVEAWGNNRIGWALVEQGKVDEGLSRIRLSLDQLSADPKMDAKLERFRLAHAHRKTGHPEEGLAEIE